MDSQDPRDGLRYTGEVHPVIFRADGKIEDMGVFKNLVVNDGMDYLAAFQSTTPGSVMNHMHVGTGTTAATLSDAALVGAVGSRRTMATRTAAANILTEVATFSGFITGVTSLILREVGVFNHAITAGTMRSRTVFSAITLGDSDFLQISYRTTVGSR